MILCENSRVKSREIHLGRDWLFGATVHDTMMNVV